MTDPESFAVGTADDGSISVRGELDLANARLCQDYLDAVIECEVGDVLVDLFQVSIIDAAGLHVLVSTDATFGPAASGVCSW